MFIKPLRSGITTKFHERLGNPSDYQLEEIRGSSVAHSRDSRIIYFHANPMQDLHLIIPCTQFYDNNPYGN